MPYCDVHGAEVVDHPDGRVAFRFGTQQLNVHGPGMDIGPLVAACPVVSRGSDPSGLAGQRRGAHSASGRNRTAVEAGPATRHDGVGEGMSTYFRDPNGSLLEFIVYTARA